MPSEELSKEFELKLMIGVSVLFIILDGLLAYAIITTKIASTTYVHWFPQVIDTIFPYLTLVPAGFLILSAYTAWEELKEIQIRRIPMIEQFERKATSHEKKRNR